MVRSFLKAKHWQLFLLMYGIPFLVEIIFLGLVVIETTSSNNFEMQFSTLFSIFFPIITLITMGAQFGWYWSIVMGLKKSLNPSIGLKWTRFKVFFFIPVCYMLLFSLYFGYSFTGMMSSAEDPLFFSSMYAFVAIIPLHLFAMFCIFHTIYFVAKTIRTAEFQREVNFSEFIGEFFLIWFNIIGIWFLQPRINNIQGSALNALTAAEEDILDA